MAQAKEHKRNQKRRRESRYLRVARIAYTIAQETLPRYSHPKSPHIYTLPQLAACVLLGFYLNISYRDLEEWLRATDPTGSCKSWGLSGFLTTPPSIGPTAGCGWRTRNG